MFATDARRTREDHQLGRDGAAAASEGEAKHVDEILWSKALGLLRRVVRRCLDEVLYYRRLHREREAQVGSHPPEAAHPAWSHCGAFRRFFLKKKTEAGGGRLEDVCCSWFRLQPTLPCQNYLAEVWGH